jgi:hypothetical protein
MRLPTLPGRKYREKNCINHDGMINLNGTFSNCGNRDNQIDLLSILELIIL